MTKGRQADSARRRQRVIAVLDKAAADGTEISVSGIARAAAVDRTFLYRHRDLLGKIHALEAAPPPAGEGAGPVVTRASLQADLLAAHERSARLHARIQQLEKRLSEALGEQAWRESGLGAPADIDTLTQQVTQLEQQIVDLRIQLEERDEELAAARAANRELMAQLNATARRRYHTAPHHPEPVLRAGRSHPDTRAGQVFDRLPTEKPCLPGGAGCQLRVTDLAAGQRMLASGTT